MTLYEPPAHDYAQNGMICACAHMRNRETTVVCWAGRLSDRSVGIR